jgi:hypothetical protein
MSVYLIDYENVHFAGLEGVEKLKPSDEVIMFYSQNASTIPMELHVKMMESSAKIQFMHIKKTAKNYLDFQLAAISGYLVATTMQTDFIVISMDTGFDSVLDLWNSQDFVGRKVHFSKRSQIAPTSSKAKKNPVKKLMEPKKKEEMSTRKNGSEPKDKEKKPAAVNVTEAAGKEKPVAPKTGNEAKAKEKPSVPKKASEGVKELAENVKTINSELLLRARAAFALPEEEKKAEPVKAEKVEKPEKTEKARVRKRISKALEKALDEVEQSVATMDGDSVEEKKSREKTKTKAKAKKLLPEEKEVIRSLVRQIDLKPAEYTKLYKLVANCEDKQSYNNELVRVFGQERCNEIYKATRKAFEDMK